MGHGGGRPPSAIDAAPLLRRPAAPIAGLAGPSRPAISRHCHRMSAPLSPRREATNNLLPGDDVTRGAAAAELRPDPPAAPGDRLQPPGRLRAASLSMRRMGNPLQTDSFPLSESPDRNRRQHPPLWRFLTLRAGEPAGFLPVGILRSGRIEGGVAPGARDALADIAAPSRIRGRTGFPELGRCTILAA